MNVFELVAKIALDTDEYDEKLDKESSKLSKIGGTVGKAVGAVGKASAAAIGAGAVAVGNLAKQAVSAYGEYEQLKGGVETLFGAQGMSMEEYAASVGKSTEEIKYDYQAMMEAQEKVLANADKAYQTAGLSANEYMQTVTSFAASLTSALGGQTDIAADVANQAILDMSDNANKMGTSMESIQNAYQGFAKQNYTMLDNLKLGYGGTKSEMERLLRDAEKLKGLDEGWFDVNNFADIVDAIHIVQDEMGITGTTAKEAASTIQGSLGMMKSSWQNLIAGLGKDGANLDELINNFVDSLETLGNNVFPIVEKALEGVGKLVSDLIPKLGERLPALLESLLPSLLDGIINLANTISQNLPRVIQTIIPPLLTAIMQNIPVLIDGLVSASASLLQTLAHDVVPQLPSFAVDVLTGLVDSLLDNIDLIVDAALQLVIGLAEGLVKAIPKLVEKVPTIIQKLVDAIVRNVPKIAKAGVELFVSLVKNTPQIIAGIVKAIPEIITAIITGFLELIPGLAGVFEDAVGAIEDVFGVIVDFFTGIWDSITGIFDGADGWFGGIFSGAVTLIESAFGGIIGFFSGIWEGIKAVFGGVADFFSSTFGAAASAVKSAFASVTDTVDATSSAVSQVVSGYQLKKNTRSGGGMPSNVPQHAEGGVFYKPTLGIFGEAGAEAVVPLDQNKKWIHAVTTELASQMGNVGLASAAGGDIIIPVYIGQNRIEEVIVSAQQRLNYRSGGRA